MIDFGIHEGAVPVAKIISFSHCTPLSSQEPPENLLPYFSFDKIYGSFGFQKAKKGNMAQDILAFGAICLQMDIKDNLMTLNKLTDIDSLRKAHAKDC